MTTRGGGLPRNAPPDIVVDTINTLAKRNVGRTVTLNVSATTTTLQDERIGPNSFIWFMPTTANASTALAGVYVSARQKGRATITHASSANSDQTFTYVVIG